MKLKTAALFTLFLACASAAFGQATPTVAEILDKYTKAIGGRAANEKIKSRVTTGTLEISPMGITGTFENYAVAPNRTYTKGAVAGIGDLLEGFDGTTAWTINPLQGNRDKQGEELTQLKLSSDFYREINLASLYPKMELKGTEKVGGSDAYVVVATPEGTQPETFYFDANTGLLVRRDGTLVSPEGNISSKTFLEDYREVDGVKIPFKIRNVLPQYEIILTSAEVKHNVAIDDAKFSKPKQ